MKNSEKANQQDRRAILLIILCWLVYSSSYAARTNYAANINLIMDYFSVSHAEAGLVSTMFFFAYGIGQVINGIFCKKYDMKRIIFASLTVSGATNLIIPLLESFAPVKYLWLVNGFSLSVLWPTLIRLLSETLSQKHVVKATLIMGTTVAVGTFFSYGLSSLFSLFSDFRTAFFTGAILLFLVALVWIFFLPSLSQGDSEPLRESYTPEIEKGKRKSDISALIFSLALFGIIVNLIKDGLITWIPSILKEKYSLDDSLSIILTLALPIVSIFGNSVAIEMNKKISDYVYLTTLFICVSGGIIGLVLWGFEKDFLILTLVGFTLVSLFASSANCLITSVFPLFMRGRVNSGLIAGVLNGFCYLGSTLSAYGLGYVADVGGWSSVLYTLLGAALISLLATAIYFISRLNKRKCKD